MIEMDVLSNNSPEIHSPSAEYFYSTVAEAVESLSVENPVAFFPVNAKFLENPDLQRVGIEIKNTLYLFVGDKKHDFLAECQSHWGLKDPGDCESLFEFSSNIRSQFYDLDRWARQAIAWSYQAGIKSSGIYHWHRDFDGSQYFPQRYSTTIMLLGEATLFCGNKDGSFHITQDNLDGFQCDEEHGYRIYQTPKGYGAVFLDEEKGAVHAAPAKLPSPRLFLIGNFLNKPLKNKLFLQTLWKDFFFDAADLNDAVL